MRQGSRWGLSTFAAVAVVAVGMAAAPAAGAAPTTLGSPLSAPFEFAGSCQHLLGCETTALHLSEPGALTASPIDGTVVRWRAAGTTATYGYRLSALRENGDGTFTASAESPVAISAGQPLETFAAELPIEAGEYVALSLPLGAGLDLLESPGSTIEAFFVPALSLGGVAAPTELETAGDEAAFDAEVEPGLPGSAQPSGPDSGADANVPPTDSTSPSTSESGATAPAPPGSVTNAPHCLVPRVGAERLAVARKKLAAADCRLGKVRGIRTGSALIVHQAPGAGKHLAAGAKVSVVLRSKTDSAHGGKR